MAGSNQVATAADTRTRKLPDPRKPSERRVVGGRISRRLCAPERSNCAWGPTIWRAMATTRSSSPKRLGSPARSRGRRTSGRWGDRWPLLQLLRKCLRHLIRRGASRRQRLGWLWGERTRGECLLVARHRRRRRGACLGRRGVTCHHQNVPARRDVLTDHESDERKPGDRDALDQWPTTALLEVALGQQ